MGQFKPMVKMMTTEPSVELKLKKGGSVKKPVKMMNGGVMGGLAAAPSAIGARGGMAPVARPKKPTMAARRAAMKGAPMGRPMMKEGGDAALEKHAAMPASKAHKGLKTGGVAMGQGGFKKGGAIYKDGIIPEKVSEKGAKSYAKTKMVTAEGEHHTPKKTGEVVMGKPGGFKHGGKAMKYAKGGGVEGNVSTSKPGVTNTKTGEVKLGNAGGYKKGGAPKKAYATGGSVNDSGRPVAYPKKPVSQSVKNNLQSGTFKKGGGVKMKDGGLSEAMRKGAEMGGLGAVSDFEREMLEEVPAAMAKSFKGMGAITDKERELLKKGAPRSVTKTEKSVTVTPAKKRGGSVKC
jgi:hypothetical protein